MAAAKILACACTLLLAGIAADDKPCAARPMPGKSVVCVCNETYCDDITRREPAVGKYVAYTSSEAGSRFRKHEGEFNSWCMWNESCSHTLIIHPTKSSQTIEGFGGAVTDSAGIQWANLTAPLQAHLINSYFSKHGIEYNMVRVPIGGCDFSTHEYAYNELPKDDSQLTNYTLAPEDIKYKIPMIQQIKATATADIHIVATVWSPPKWMKTNEKPYGFNEIKPQYMQTFAEYIAKFIREYKKHNIDVWAVTTTNEPQNAIFQFVPFQDLGWTPEKMGKWIIQNLGPTIRKSADLKHVKILTVDDQRSTIPYWFNLMVDQLPEVLDWIDGVAVHWYVDKLFPAKLFEMVTKKYPNKFIIGTEACAGGLEKVKVSLGDWSRAQDYVHDIIDDLNYELVGWIDWNLCLDKTGGPNWAAVFVDSPVIVFPEKKELFKQPMFYAMGHFSKWIPRGSVRIQVEQRKDLFVESVEHVVVLTPRKTIVLVIHNTEGARKVRVQLGEKQALVELEKASVTTVEFPAPAQ